MDTIKNALGMGHKDAHDSTSTGPAEPTTTTTATTTTVPDPNTNQAAQSGNHHLTSDYGFGNNSPTGQVLAGNRDRADGKSGPFNPDVKSRGFNQDAGVNTGRGLGRNDAIADQTLGGQNAAHGLTGTSGNHGGGLTAGQGQTGTAGNYGSSTTGQGLTSGSGIYDSTNTSGQGQTGTAGNYGSSTTGQGLTSGSGIYDSTNTSGQGLTGTSGNYNQGIITGNSGSDATGHQHQHQHQHQHKHDPSNADITCSHGHPAGTAGHGRIGRAAQDLKNKVEGEWEGFHSGDGHRFECDTAPEASQFQGGGNYGAQGGGLESSVGGGGEKDFRGI